MANSNNLGYTTHILSTIKSITECKRILVYNRNSFVSDLNYNRLTLYNLVDVFNNALVDENNTSNYGFNNNCLLINRSMEDEEDITNNPFKYTCNNLRTSNGFNIIIYLSNLDGSPVGFTEFVNTQGRISERIFIYLKFNIKGIELELHLSNSLYKIKDTLEKDFIGTELNEYTSNFVIDDDIKKIIKDSKYTTHLSSYLNKNNKNNIYLNDRFLNSDKNMIKLNLQNNYDFGLSTEFEKQQATYYREDIVIYSWKIVDNQIRYQIVSAINGQSYIESDFYDTIDFYDSKVLSQDVLYCAGKYIVVKLVYKNSTKVKLFDTENINWVETTEDNVVVDPFDREAEIYELPRSVSIQSLDTAYFLFPDLVNIYLDLGNYLDIYRELEVFRKIGDWIIIKNKKDGKNFYIATNMFSVVYMTEDDYNNMIVINDSAFLINEETYYVVYYGVRKKTYYTEKARSLDTGFGLTTRTDGFKICEDSEYEDYIELYNKKEIDIIFKESDLLSSIFNQFRKRPLNRYTVPSNIVSAVGGIIYYKENNKLSYI